MTLDELEKLIGQLSSAEKLLVLRWVARDITADAFSGIESRPEVCGGDACIVRTRIPVWLLVALRRAGRSESDLLADYPSLRAEDLANAWAYARRFPDEIESQLLAHESA